MTLTDYRPGSSGSEPPFAKRRFFKRAMISLLSYLCLLGAAAAVMVITDDDPTRVSLYEWVLFGVIIFAAVSLVRRLWELRQEMDE